jgi:hypothetical protein
VEHSPGDLEAARHAPRIGRDQVLAPVREGNELEHPGDARLDLFSGHAVEDGVEAQVLLGGQLVVEGLLLEDEPDVSPHRPGVGDDVEAGHACRSGGRPGQRASILMVVDFPAPLGPRKAKISPWATSKLTPFTAVRSP